MKTIQFIKMLGLSSFFFISSPLFAANYFIRVGALDDGFNSRIACNIENGQAPSAPNFEGSQNCNLRNAINLANQYGSDSYSTNNISILLSPGEHVLSLLRTGNDSLPDNEQGDLDINLNNPDSQLFIQGSNSSVTQRGAESRIFDIHRGQVTLQSFTIFGGYAGPFDAINLSPTDPRYQQAPKSGGAINNRSLANLNLRNMRLERNLAIESGGGIHNAGTLNLYETSLRGNEVKPFSRRGFGYNCQIMGIPLGYDSAESGIFDAYSSGGGISNNGISASANIFNSEISNNLACRSGGGLVNDNHALMNIINTTFFNNKAVGYATNRPALSSTIFAKIGDGGAIANLRNAELNLNFSTLYRNEATRRGGAISNGLGGYSLGGDTYMLGYHSAGAIKLKGNLIFSNLMDSDFLATNDLVRNSLSFRPQIGDCSIQPGSTLISNDYNTSTSGTCVPNMTIYTDGRTGGSSPHDSIVDSASTGMSASILDSRTGLAYFSHRSVSGIDSLPSPACTHPLLQRVSGSLRSEERPLTRDQLNNPRPQNGVCDRGAIESVLTVGTPVGVPVETPIRTPVEMPVIDSNMPMSGFTPSKMGSPSPKGSEGDSKLEQLDSLEKSDSKESLIPEKGEELEESKEFQKH